MADEYTRDQNILLTMHFFINVVIRAAIALLQYNSAADSDVEFLSNLISLIEFDTAEIPRMNRA